MSDTQQRTLTGGTGSAAAGAILGGIGGNAGLGAIAGVVVGTAGGYLWDHHKKTEDSRAQAAARPAPHATATGGSVTGLRRRR
jgi:hypothetical protein